MELCCGLVVLGVIVWIVGSIWSAIDDAEKAHRDQHNSAIWRVEQERENLIKAENALEGRLANMLNNSAINYSYEEMYKEIDRMEKEMGNTIERLKRSNENLVKISKSSDRSDSIIAEETRVINHVKKIKDDLKIFEQKVYALSQSKMMDINSYGKINRLYWDNVCGMQRNEVLEYISRCETLLNGAKLDEIYSVNLEEILKCIWFLATETTFSSTDFKKACNIFNKIYKFRHVDVTIADLYAKKKMGGEDVLRDAIRDMLDKNGIPGGITIASGLMWMNAYQCEHLVLQHMLKAGVEMPAKAQERLHSLSNGGGKAPNGFDVSSSKTKIYFDVSALAWRDEEYAGLFENIAFQDKALSYSLAVRDENKDMFIAQGINVPSTKVVLEKFRKVFAEEYGANVMAQAVDCTALSGSGEEKLEGILVSSDECKQLGVLIHIAKIGKKLIIKFYTLFMPIGDDLVMQKQQALSMYKRLSPSVTMWESSLKDTMLMAVEQLLNEGDAGNGYSSDKVNSATNKPIF